MPVLSIVFIAAVLGLMTYDVVAVQPAAALAPTIETQKIVEEKKETAVEVAAAEPAKPQPVKKVVKKVVKKKKAKKPIAKPTVEKTKA